MSSMLEFQNICKYFPGVKALDNISFKAYAGEVPVRSWHFSERTERGNPHF